MPAGALKRPSSQIARRWDSPRPGTATDRRCAVPPAAAPWRRRIAGAPCRHLGIARAGPPGGARSPGPATPRSLGTRRPRPPRMAAHGALPLRRLPGAEVRSPLRPPAPAAPTAPTEPGSPPRQTTRLRASRLRRSLFSRPRCPSRVRPAGRWRMRMRAPRALDAATLRDPRQAPPAPPLSSRAGRGRVPDPYRPRPHGV